MPKFKGTVRKSEFGGGWELHTDGGDVFELAGGAGLAEGAKVEISGRVDEGAMSLSMRGPIIRVESVRKL